ncbi:Protein_disulfide isomerase PDI4 [Hexamita inflata]|uniref:Protein disulfide isomerase PDI4 n=1 Tax=Hexamita inflata TaxID=28002 RepID=A0AA86QSG5_9EUKA|nr:Protein disulfide isomerase PDI4 [Hexamita inflata]
MIWLFLSLSQLMDIDQKIITDQPYLIAYYTDSEDSEKLVDALSNFPDLNTLGVNCSKHAHLCPNKALPQLFLHSKSLFYPYNGVLDQQQIDTWVQQMFKPLFVEVKDQAAFEAFMSKQNTSYFIAFGPDQNTIEVELSQFKQRIIIGYFKSNEFKLISVRNGVKVFFKNETSVTEFVIINRVELFPKMNQDNLWLVLGESHPTAVFCFSTENNLTHQIKQKIQQDIHKHQKHQIAYLNPNEFNFFKQFSDEPEFVVWLVTGKREWKYQVKSLKKFNVDQMDEFMKIKEWKILGQRGGEITTMIQTGKITLGVLLTGFVASYIRSQNKQQKEQIEEQTENVEERSEIFEEIPEQEKADHL